MDVDTPKEQEEGSFGDAFLFAEAMPLKIKHKTAKIKMRGFYRKYTSEQIEKLFDLIIEEDFTAKDAALAHRNQCPNCPELC